MLGKRKRVIEPAPLRIAGWDPTQLQSLLTRLAGQHAMLNLRITGYEHTLRFEGPKAEPQDTFVGRLNYPEASVEGVIVSDGDHDRGFGRVTLTASDGVDGRVATPHVNVVIRPSGEDQIVTIREALKSALGCGGKAWLNMKLEPVTDPALESQRMMEHGYGSSLTVERMIFGTSVGEARP